MQAETSPVHSFRSSGTYGNIRLRECEHCCKRTKQKQAQDESRRWVEKFRCQTCDEETA
jgi:hypothetical protein